MEFEVKQIMRQAYLQYGNAVFCDSHKLNTYLHDLLAKFPSERKKLSVAISENILTNIISDQDSKKQNIYISILTSTYGFSKETAVEIVETLYYTVDYISSQEEKKQVESCEEEVVIQKENTDNQKEDLIFGNRYKVENVVDENDVTITYIAKCLLLNRKVKLHLLKKKIDSDTLQKIKNRIADISEINHDNLVKVFDYYLDNDTCYVVDEMITGASVHDVMSFGGSFTENEVLGFACQIADVLEKLHNKNICNFGLSSMRVLIDMNSKIKLQCNYFYFVENLERIVTEENLLYCSPEKARGGYVDYHSDVYLFGLILYELMVGAPPFVKKESPIAMGLQHCNDIPVPPSEKGVAISSAFEKIILNALEKNASERESLNKINWTINAIINGYEIKEENNYNVRLVRQAIAPFKVDIYVDGKLHSKKIDQNEYVINLSAGQHIIEIGCGDLVSAMLSGHGLIRSLSKERLKVNVDSERTITYALNRWTGGLKLINKE